VVPYLLLLFLSPVLGSESGLRLNIDVKEFRLGNGMLFLVVERPATPQVACRLAIRAGSALEEAGKTGIAHMLEHMLFKGTKNFGTLDHKMDQALQAESEASYQVVLEERKKRNPDQKLISKKLAEMDQLRREVQQIYVAQAFSSQLGKNGAVGAKLIRSRPAAWPSASGRTLVIRSAMIGPTMGPAPAMDEK